MLDDASAVAIDVNGDDDDEEDANADDNVEDDGDVASGDKDKPFFSCASDFAVLSAEIDPELLSICVCKTK